MAWGSTVFTPTWCQSPDDWASRFAAFLWTSCPCCMVFRGIIIGTFLSGIFWLVAFLLYANLN